MTTLATMRAATPTEIMVASMLVENTGAALMDSGGAGRIWQRERARLGLDSPPNSTFSGFPVRRAETPTYDDLARVALILSAEPAGHIDSSGLATISTFHFLVDRLEYDAGQDAKFRRYVDKLWAARDRISWPHEPGAIEMFLDALEGRGVTITERHGVNTSNHDSQLDRTLQYEVFEVDNWESDKEEYLDDGIYVALQVHGGADVRGGYTDARLFTINEAYSLSDDDQIGFGCEGGKPTRPDDAPPIGQVGIDGTIVVEAKEEHHYWDLSYGDGRARDEDERVLVLARDDEVEALIEDGVENGYGGRDTPMISRWDDETKTWRCPVDGSAINAYPEPAS